MMRSALAAVMPGRSSNWVLLAELTFTNPFLSRFQPSFTPCAMAVESFLISSVAAAAPLRSCSRESLAFCWLQVTVRTRIPIRKTRQANFNRLVNMGHLFSFLEWKPDQAARLYQLFRGSSIYELRSVVSGYKLNNCNCLDVSTDGNPLLKLKKPSEIGVFSKRVTLRIWRILYKLRSRRRRFLMMATRT